MLGANRSAGAAPEANLKECVTQMPPPSVNKTAHSGLEIQRRRYQKSKTGVSVALQKWTCVHQNFKNKPYFSNLSDMKMLTLPTLYYGKTPNKSAIHKAAGLTVPGFNWYNSLIL